MSSTTPLPPDRSEFATRADMREMAALAQTRHDEVMRQFSDLRLQRETDRVAAGKTDLLVKICAGALSAIAAAVLTAVINYVLRHAP